MSSKIIYLCQMDEDSDIMKAFEEQQSAVEYCNENEGWHWTTIPYFYKA